LQITWFECDADAEILFWYRMIYDFGLWKMCCHELQSTFDLIAFVSSLDHDLIITT
jgi:hypothetical protein